MVFLNLRTISDVGGTTAGQQELELVVEKIDQVIAQIETEQDLLQPVTFAFGASIAPGSFGGADSAPNLSHHYSRAHEVTWKTLRGVKEDLVSFREACVAARDAVREADDTAATQMRTVTHALDVIAAGGQGSGSRRAHQDARQNQDTRQGQDNGEGDV